MKKINKKNCTQQKKAALKNIKDGFYLFYFIEWEKKKTSANKKLGAQMYVMRV